MTFVLITMKINDYKSIKLRGKQFKTGIINSCYCPIISNSHHISKSPYYMLLLFVIEY